MQAQLASSEAALAMQASELVKARDLALEGSRFKTVFLPACVMKSEPR